MYLYRYSRFWYDENRVRVHLDQYLVLRETPEGYWFSIDSYHKKWTSKNTLRRYAYPTKKEALTSFIARQKRSIALCNRNIYAAKKAMEEATNILNTL